MTEKTITIICLIWISGTGRQGVALYGMWKYYRLTGEKKYLDYLQQWFDTKLNRPIVHNINTMAPLLTLCFLYEETGNKEYLNYCENCAE